MGGRIPDRSIDEISSRVDLLELVGPYVELRRQGGRWWGLCPFHTERTASFSVNPENNLWYCFGCHRGGGPFQFLMEIDGLSFPEAVRTLSEKVGVVIPQETGGKDWTDDRRALEALYGRVAGTFRWLLQNHPDAKGARDYLSNRGVDDHTAELYRLGWAPGDGEWLYSFLIKKGYGPDFLKKSGLFSKKHPRFSYFINRLMFPIITSGERVVAFSGRALSERNPKYLNSPQTILYTKGSQLFGLAQAAEGIRKSKRTVLCEGNMDVLGLHRAGIHEAVAPLGTAFTEPQARLLRRRAETVILAFDGDEAGLRATLKAAILSESAGLSIRVAALPFGTDPAELALREGPATLKKIVEGSINAFEYLLNSTFDAKSGGNGEAREQILEKLIPYLDVVQSEIRKEAYLRRLSEVTGAGFHVLIGEYQTKKGLRQKRRSGERKERKNTLGGDELYLMSAVFTRPELFLSLRDSLVADDLKDEWALYLYEILERLTEKSKIPRTDSLIEAINNKELREFVLERVSSGMFDENVETLVSDGVRGIKRKALIRERQEIESGMIRYEKAEPERLKALIERKKLLDREIHNMAAL